MDEERCDSGYVLMQREFVYSKIQSCGNTFADDVWVALMCGACSNM